MHMKLQESLFSKLQHNYHYFSLFSYGDKKQDKGIIQRLLSSTKYNAKIVIIVN